MVEILQLNIGLYCNQACNHCHVESSPRRHEMMDRKTADRCLEVLRNSPSITTLDITGKKHIQSTLVILTSLILNNCLSRSENLVSVFNMEI